MSDRTNPAPDDEMFPVQMLDGTIVERRADTIRAGIEATETPNRAARDRARCAASRLQAAGWART